MKIGVDLKALLWMLHKIACPLTTLRRKFCTAPEPVNTRSYCRDTPLPRCITSSKNGRGASLANQTVDGLLAEFDIHPPDKTNFNRARQLTLGDSEDAVVAVIVGCLRTNGLESKT
jgi:hypothetical protein